MNNNDLTLYDWIFHYNVYIGVWCAIPRNLYNDYWNNSDIEGVIKSDSIETLQEILYKTKGDPEKLKLIS